MKENNDIYDKYKDEFTLEEEESKDLERVKRRNTIYAPHSNIYDNQVGDEANNSQRYKEEGDMPAPKKGKANKANKAINSTNIDPKNFSFKNPDDPENDGSSYAEENNKKAYAKTRELINKLSEAVDANIDNNLEQNQEVKKKIENDLEEFIAVVNNNDAIKDHFEDGWDKKLKENYQSNGLKPLQKFLNEEKVQFGIKADELQNNEANNENNRENSNDNNNENEINNQDNREAKLAELEAQKAEIQKQIDELNAEKERNRQNDNEANKDKKKDKSKDKSKEKKLDTSLKHFPDIDDEEKKEHIKYWSEKGFETIEDIDENLLDEVAEEAREVKYFSKKLKAEAHFGSSKKFKTVLNSINELDQFMKEIGGRTRLTPDEVAMFDAISFTATLSCQNYKKAKNEEVKKRKKIKGQDGELKDDIKDSEKIRLKGTDDMENRIQQMREKVFESTVNKKVEQIQAKVEEEKEKLNAARNNLANQPFSEDARSKLEDNIARTLFYNNRLEDLGKQERVKVMKGESLNKGLARLERDFEPTTSNLGSVKKTDLCKSLVDTAMEKLKKGEVLTEEEIMGAQESYIKAEAEKIRRQKLRQKNINTKRDHKKDNEMVNNVEEPHL